MNRRAFVSITIDQQHGVALLRGAPAEVRIAASVADVPVRWSDAGRGLVVDLARLADLIAAAEHRGLFRVGTERERGA